MRYTALEKLFIFLFSLIIIACFILFTVFHAERIAFLYLHNATRNPYDVLCWLVISGFIVLLCFSIKGIYTGIKYRLKIKFFVFSVIINLIFICLFNPLTFYFMSYRPVLLNLSFWIPMNIIVVIYVATFIIKILAEAEDTSDLE
ncbi:MAG TPA: hypothetical protein QF753_03400 [Victivallales bacterium]|nr:hypothetical protein [Victivallales bacterium]